MMMKKKQKKKDKKPKTQTEIEKIIRVYNFRKFSNKVLSHQKKMTMRLPRERPSEKGNLMHPYIIFYPGEGRITKIVSKPIDLISEKEAIMDGFNSLKDCQKGLMEMHDCSIHQMIDLTYFNPYWKPLQIINLENLIFIRDRLATVKKSLVTYPRTELDNVEDMLTALIDEADPRVDNRSLDVYIK